MSSLTPLSFSQPRKVKEPNPEQAVIVIPSMDPGRDKYGSQPDSLRRVLLLTAIITVAMADLTERATRTATSGADAIERTMAVWNSFPPYRALDRALDAAKTELRSEWQAANSRAKTFVAEDAPGSAVREQQILALWRFNWPELHQKHGRKDEDDWFAWAMQIGEGKSYFASAEASGDSSDRLSRLCQQFAPDEDLNDPKVRQRVFELAAERLRSGWTANHFSSQLQADRGRQRAGYRKQGRAVSTLVSVPVRVWADGRLNLALLLDDGKVVDAELRGSMSAVPMETTDERYVQAMDAGLNLQDQDANVFKFQDTNSTTWPKTTLARHNRASALIAAWSAAMGHPFELDDIEAGPVPATMPTVVFPSNLYGSKDTSVSISVKKRPLRAAAPQTNDYDWFMWVWLQDLDQETE
ncbi:hypothetical protein OC861_006913 [Tilletia horrida]|nr:hypothetical protein OC845_006824 [Tilletia horrida]KAK0558415.1 hypothetical protein OC861_006913 [Tilletia horrida]